MAAASSSSSSSFSYFTSGLVVVSLLVTPVCLSHWFVDDCGLPMMTDGKYTLENIDPLHKHLCAILAAAELCLYFLMIAVSHCQPQAKSLVAIVYGLYMTAATIIQFTHPFTGEPPKGLFEMPMPLLYVFISVVFGGYIMDMKKEQAAEINKSRTN